MVTSIAICFGSIDANWLNFYSEKMPGSSPMEKDLCKDYENRKNIKTCRTFHAVSGIKFF